MTPNNSWGEYFYNISSEHRHALFWLMSITASLILVGLGLRDPWPADEPRFALVAKEMVDTGQWFFPARAQELYPDKPPIFMWSIAFFYWVTDSITVAFLLPSALSGLLTVFLVYDIGRKLWSTQVGFIAGLLLTFSIQFMLQAKTAQIDAMVCAFITLGCYGLLRFTLVDGKWRWYFMAWFFMGIGVITKGVGFLPLLMLIPYILLRLSGKQYAQAPIISHHWFWYLGPLVMLFAISLWFVPMLWWVEQSQNPLYEVYRDNILFKQTVTRYANSWHHIKPFWYYLTSVIPVFWLPISLALPWLVKPWCKAIKQLDARIILPLSWIMLVILFFSLSSGKRGVYVLPALPMLALITAPYFAQLLKSKVLVSLVWTTVGLLSTAFVVFALAGFAEVSFTVGISDKYNIVPWLFFLIIGGAGIFSCAWCFKGKKWQSWPIFITVLWGVYSTLGYQLLNDVRTPKNIYREVSNIIEPDAEVALVDFSEQFILFSPYPITHFGYHTQHQKQLAAAWEWQKTQPQRYVIMNYELVTDCFDKNKAMHLGFAHRVDWVLLNAASRLDSCTQAPENLPEYRYGY
ncbi:glycosyltransferase family 39 protein [Shewanella inventionis]|uniref:Glycosyl transferase n=1 Tax=Shewanella inventionis TaxID=1738770 RepID=A0ABQ1JUA2_9GAMM|nr:glycosyltransferase family 39 protein [Shewanella inventionis]MCL1159927.1 glycosyltransferase family 39 protein [Shewanella inventionis]UAL43944.1 glycosyltransferase family 39 protein [Shewanella inventionis]GGB74899.1 glycosyl transferase [Shewanella inventionis]